jgi:hypothetical protein
MSKHEWEKSYVVQAMQMIGVFMSVKHGMDKSDLLSKQLGTKVRSRINQQVPLRQPYNGTGPGALIARMPSGAHIATATQTRHTDARPRP